MRAVRNTDRPKRRSFRKFDRNSSPAGNPVGLLFFRCAGRMCPIVWVSGNGTAASGIRCIDGRKPRGVEMQILIFLSECMVPLMIFYIIGFGLLSGRPVMDDFLEGVKEGMRTVAGILPTLVALMVSVGVLRASGFLDFLGEVLKAPAALVHLPPQIVPVILVRLVSNSAATGLVLDIFKEFGTDSNLGLIASLLMSSTETVLYCMSVYFGAAKITRTRYTLAGALIATAAGVAASVVLAGVM